MAGEALLLEDRGAVGRERRCGAQADRDAGCDFNQTPG
jgi:hypothetical protein